MEATKIYLVAILGMVSCFALGQTFSFSGKINDYNRMDVSASTAGQNPINLSIFNTNSGTNNTSQSIKYKWPFLGTEYEEQTYLYADVNVYSSIPVPSGLQWTIQAATTSAGNYGTSTGAQILTTESATLLNDIWSTAPSSWYLVFWSFMAANTNNTFTQVLSVTNFADIHPTPNGAYQTITLYYSLE